MLEQNNILSRFKGTRGVGVQSADPAGRNRTLSTKLRTESRGPTPEVKREKH